MRNYIVQKATQKVEKANISSYFVDENFKISFVHEKKTPSHLKMPFFILIFIPGLTFSKSRM